MSQAARPGPSPVVSASSDHATASCAATPHVGSQARYCAGCHCTACRAAHADYQADWRVGDHRSADTAPVRAHLQQLVASGLVLGYLADEAGVPRSTVYGIWRGARRTAPATATALLMLRPLRIADALPTTVRERDALAAGQGRARHRATVAELDLHRACAQRLAQRLGVSARTVQRWRATRAAAAEGGVA